MQYVIDNGIKKPTHVRVVNQETGKARNLALVVALNDLQMQNMNFVIEDPEYDLFLMDKGKKSSIPEIDILMQNKAKEEAEPIEEVEEERPIIEDLTPKSKAGRKPSKK